MTLFNEQMTELLALRASVKSLGEKLEASQARIELLEHDAKTGDYETLYAQAVCELQAAHAREAQLREALRDEFDAWTDTLRDATERGDEFLSVFSEQRVKACERALAKLENNNA